MNLVVGPPRKRKPVCPVCEKEWEGITVTLEKLELDPSFSFLAGTIPCSCGSGFLDVKVSAVWKATEKSTVQAEVRGG